MSRIWSKIKNRDYICKRENTWRIFCQDLWNWSLFLWALQKKIQVDNNDQEYILFRIDIYFTEYSLVVEIDEEGHTDRDLVFEEKRQKVLEKKLNCKFITINTSRKNYDADYAATRIQMFIKKFKDKENKNKIKKLKDEIKKLKLQLTNQNVQNNDDNYDNDDNDK